MARWSPPPRTGQPVASTPSVRVSQRRPSGLRWLLGLAGKWTIPIVGGITPVALIMVNAAVWINDHVSELRVWIAVAAFLSGMMLNTWWCLRIYRVLRRRWPHWGIFDESREELLLVIGMGGVTVVTFVLALGCYYGLGDTKHLPNAFTLWWGLLQIIIPFVAKVIFDRDAGRERAASTSSDGGRGRTANLAGPESRGTLPRSGSGGGGSGYTPPPGYLPPS